MLTHLLSVLFRCRCWSGGGFESWSGNAVAGRKLVKSREFTSLQNYTGAIQRLRIELRDQRRVDLEPQVPSPSAEFAARYFASLCSCRTGLQGYSTTFSERPTRTDSRSQRSHQAHHLRPRETRSLPPLSTMRHRPTASQEWRQHQQQSQSQPMSRSQTEPIYPPTAGGARPGLAPQQPSSNYQLDSYYDQLQHQQDLNYGYHQDGSSHTALTLEKEPHYYNDAAPSLPPQPQYGAPNYPPSSPAFSSRPPPTPFSGNLPYHNQYGPPLSPVGPPSFYAQAREGVMRRREQAKVELVDGHLRLDLPVPRSLKQIISFQGQDMREESGKMR